ncbi:MAG: DUF6125 family protein [Dehalococcoidia bacterium]
MEEQKDYSGQFDSGLRVDDFSKETLVKLWLSSSKLFTGIAGLYLSDLRARFGDKIGFELDEEVWRKTIPLEIKFVTEAINSCGHDVAAVFKFLQCYAAAGGQMDMELDLKKENHGIFTVKKCQAYAKGRDPETTKHYCGMCQWGWELQAHIINPNLKVTCLKLPPPKSKEEIACQWEYKL